MVVLCVSDIPVGTERVDDINGISTTSDQAAAAVPSWHQHSDPAGPDG